LINKRSKDDGQQYIVNIELYEKLFEISEKLQYRLNFKLNLISGVMVSMFVLSTVDRGLIAVYPLSTEPLDLLFINTTIIHSC
jgi:hypothetical protein